MRDGVILSVIYYVRSKLTAARPSADESLLISLCSEQVNMARVQRTYCSHEEPS